MKASLEPKEQSIETLKTNLSDLEKLFEMQTKALDNLRQDVEARRSQVKTLSKQLKKTKGETKKHEQKIQDFIQELQRIMQKESDSEKISGLMKIYKNNVKDHADQVLEKKKKDPETIEELDKHLKYMEKAISQLKKSTAH